MQNDLLLSTKVNAQAFARKGTIPLAMEFQVKEETAPYLVTSSNALVWVEEPHSGGVIRAAVRKITPMDLYREILGAVVKRGREDEWGNIGAYSQEGLFQILGHLRFYGMTSFDVLGPGNGESYLWGDTMARGIPWVPEGCIVVVPRDRTFVGLLGELPTGVVAVAHNASRSIGILSNGL